MLGTRIAVLFIGLEPFVVLKRFVSELLSNLIGLEPDLFTIEILGCSLRCEAPNLLSFGLEP